MTEDHIPKHVVTSGRAGCDEPEAKGARAGKPGKPEPRRAGQVVERGKNKFLIRVFVGKDASGKRQTLYDDLRAGGLGAQTITQVHAMLRSVFKLAIMRKRIRENPMDGVNSPRGKKLTQEMRRKRESKVMTPEEARSFLSEAEQTRHGALFALAFHTGCRPGELLAVPWPDLDTDAMTLRVWRNIKWPVGGKWYLDDPKTDSSRRALRLDGGIVERWPRTESASLRNA